MSPPSWVRVYRDPADWWIGLYIGPNHLYLCLLPTVVIRIRRPTPGVTTGEQR